MTLWQDVRTDSMMVLLPSDHELAQKESVDPADLKDLSHILFEISLTSCSRKASR
jgi:hypothetical protein